MLLFCGTPPSTQFLVYLLPYSCIVWTAGSSAVHGEHVYYVYDAMFTVELCLLGKRIAGPLAPAIECNLG